MPADLPALLSDRVLLVAHHVKKERVAGGSFLPLAISAAVFTELWRDGHLVDDGGKVALARGRRAVVTDPAQSGVLQRLEASKPRTWKAWATKDTKKVRDAVQARLAEERRVRVSRRRVLGVFPWTVVTVRDTRVPKELVSRCRRAVLDGSPVDRVDDLDAALVGLVAAIELNTVFSGKERRAHRERIKALSERSGPAVLALRKAVTDAQAASGAAG